MSNKIFKCTIGPFHISDAFSIVDLLFDDTYLATSCVEKKDDDWFVEILSETSFDPEKLKDKLSEYAYTSFDEEILENIDWLTKCFENFKPITIGNFYIFGPHLRSQEKPSSKIAIEVAAATAFGTGEHPTTSRCLLACQSFFDPQIHKKALDIGCGSGILSIALAKLEAESVKACDNDPEAVRVTRKNIAINHVAHRVEVFQNKGAEFKLQKYDFIIANILAAPLISLAESIIESLKDDGILVLSGFNSGDRSVLDVYTSMGLEEKYRYEYKGWTTLVMNKKRTSN